MAELQTEEEQLAALRSFWQSYGWWLLLLALLILAGYLGLGYYRDAQVAKSQAAGELFDEYLQNLEDDERSDALLTQLDGDYAGTAYHVFSLWQRAQQSVLEGDIEGAVSYYEQVIAAEAHPQLSSVARLRLARAHQQLGRSDAALEALGAVQGEGYQSLVAELKGDIHRSRGEIELAREAYAAALASAAENSTRPILEMKIAELPAVN